MRTAVLNNRLQLVRNGRILDVGSASDGAFSGDPMEAFDRWAELAELAAGTSDDQYEEYDVRTLQNPVPRPRQVFAIGANYRDHLEEAGASEPDEPLIFTKFPSCLTGPFDPIPLPTTKVDWEVELVLVIGREARNVSESDAWSVVAGLTVGQDISERPMQLRGNKPQFSMGKSFEGFGPLGPEVVSVDEFDNPDAVALGCAIDDETLQSSNTSNLIFPVPDIISRLSAVCTLCPGDVVFTGTPAGVGAFRSPRRYLRPGEELRSWIDGIGELRNPIVAGDGYPKSEAVSANAVKGAGE